MPINALQLVKIAVAILLALAAGRFTFASVLGRAAPDTVIALDGDNPVALMQRIDTRLSVEGMEMRPLKTWRSDSLRAVQSRPLNVSALRTMALVHVAEKNVPSARTLMLLSDRLTRRDVVSQMWLMRDKAEQNDVRQTLRHMDNVLSSNNNVEPILFPILAKAMTDPSVPQDLAILVKQDRPWLKAFLSFSVTETAYAKGLADTVRLAGGLPPGTDYRGYESDILWLLAKADDLPTAAQLVVAIRRATPALLADGRMTKGTTNVDMGPFAWAISDNTDISTTYDGEGRVRASVLPGKNGTFLQRTMALPPGAYQIQSQTQLDSENAAPVTGLQINCVNAEKSVILTAENNVSAQKRALGGMFSVPNDCPLQRILFIAVGADSQFQSEFILSDITVRSVGRAASPVR